jgi:hypothetical protein
MGDNSNIKKGDNSNIKKGDNSNIISPLFYIGSISLFILELSPLIIISFFILELSPLFYIGVIITPIYKREKTPI